MGSRDVFRCRAGVVPAVLVPALMGTALFLSVLANAGSLDQWRVEAGRVRVLAENDAPSAYEAAKRLQASLPADATPVDLARGLNLLSRIETYLALTEPAAAHAHEAFELAAKNGDRVGQAEADLNIALNGINQGKLGDMVTAAQHSVAVLEGVNRPDLLGEAMLRTTMIYRKASPVRIIFQSKELHSISQWSEVLSGR